MELNPHADFLCLATGSHGRGLDAKGAICPHEEWVAEQNIKGVYVLSGTTPKLLHAISAYNNQLSKQCIVGAYTALELRGYSHSSVIGQTASLSIYRKNKQASFVDAVSRLGT